MHDGAVRIREDLELDVPRTVQVAFQQHGVVAERRARFAPCRRQRLVERRRILDHAHAASAAAGHRFNHQRRIEHCRFAPQHGVVLIVAVVAVHHRHAGRAHAPLGFALRTHRGDGGRARSDEDQARIEHRLRERRAFGEKSIARMHGVGAELARGGDDRRAVEVRFRGRSGSDAYARVECFAKERPFVGVGVHADRRHAELARAARDANRDFTAIGDEQPPDHRSCQPAGRRSRNARSPS